MFSIFCYLLLALFEFETILAIQNAIGISNANFNDRKINYLSIANVFVKTRIACIRLCASTPSCFSCASNKDTGQCLLYDTQFIESADATTLPEMFWMYYMVVPLSERYPNRTGCYQYPGSYMYVGPCTLYCFHYTSFSTSITLAVAESHCASKNSELVKVDQDLKHYCVEKLLDSVTDGETFIQGKRIKGVWRYNDGSKMSFFKWDIAGNQPGTDEDAIALLPYYNFLWHDFNSTNNVAKGCVCDLY